MHDARKELLVSFLIFAASVVIGIISAWNDPDFVRLILGNGYVDMTLENIANGQPMAVYNGSEEMPMFLGITLNNIMVSFNCFAMGLLTSFGTGYMLLSNGIMLRAFKRVHVKSGEKKQISIHLPNDSFEFFDPEFNVMRVMTGEYEVLYGTSSEGKDLKKIKVRIQ